MTGYIDPVTGKHPRDMNIVEWCDWEHRARQDFYAEKRAAKKQDSIDRREARVGHIENLIQLLGELGPRTVAERIDQAHFPEAWGIPVTPKRDRKDRA